MPDQNTPSWDQNRLGWLTLASFEGFGSRSLSRLASYIQDGAEAAHLSSADIEKLGLNGSVAQKFIEFRGVTDAGKIAEQMDACGMRLILFNDPDYPPLLKQIADPPFALFARGNLDLPAVCVALVGTRHCTTYGRNAAELLSRGLARAGLGIVSGLALGIDARAHEAALEENGWCIAVLGTGCDDASIYPRANFRLGLNILENGGCLLSEYPPGTGSLKQHFPLRNRIIAGLSRAVVVIEADQDSGSLITAHLGLGYNRDVLAVPGSIFSPVSSGTNKLLKLGATPCVTASDVLEMLELPAQEPKKVFLEDLKHEDRRLLEHLSTPLHIDELARLTGSSIAQIAQQIAVLELGSYVIDHGGKIFSRSIAVREKRK